MASLLDHLAQRYPTAKRTTLRRMLGAGRVRVGGRVVRDAKCAVGATDVIDVNERPTTPDDATSPPKATLAPLRWVHEDADLLVVVKPPGLLTSTTPREKRPTALAVVRRYFEGSRDVRVGLIHRLDRDASGLLVLSKTSAAYESLKAQFFHHTVDRVYLALVGGVPDPPAGRIETSLVERADGTVRVAKNPGEGQVAVTEYEVIRVLRKRSLVRVRLHTGRKHQIRAHLASRGTPIIGDAVYGQASDAGLMLCAVHLALDHPRTGVRMTWETEMPPFMRAAIRA